MEPERLDMVQDASECDALLGGDFKPTKKRFYRARPMWIVPFAIVAAISRGMTTAPRVEVFTQLSCNSVHGHPYGYNHTDVSIRELQFETHSFNTGIHATFHPLNQTENDGDSADPTLPPSKRCLADPAVQAGAARLQTIMMTTMGLLSAITTGWWGRYGERHGRTRVLAAATLGLMLTDLIFIVVSTQPDSLHGHKLLIVAPIIEGLLGGWPTLQAATSAYVSDCTSSGSRAHIFSRFTGVYFTGFAIGPMIGALVMSHPPPMPFVSAPTHSGHSVTAVFWVAIIVQLLNFLVAFCVLPESLEKARRKAQLSDGNLAQSLAKQEKPGFFKSLTTPFVVFAPKRKVCAGGRVKTDWSMTFIALALFGYLLSAGLYQLKYLYAEHVFGWDAKQLSYYITSIGGTRAFYLLFIMPVIVAAFKPKPPPKMEPQSMSGLDAEPSAEVAKVKPKEHLAAEMRFDLRLTYFSFAIDFLSHALVSVSSTAPTLGASLAFSGFTMLSSVGSGVVPALQSLALCIMQTEAEEERELAISSGVASSNVAMDTGSLFGAFSVLQATGQMIFGPMLFGLVYSLTVATFPKGIFVLAASFVAVAMSLVMFVRTPGKKPKRKTTWEEEVERGRSRASKDLTGLGGDVQYAQNGSFEGRS